MVTDTRKDNRDVIEASTDDARQKLCALLRQMAQMGASDLHLVPKRLPCVRVRRELVPMEGESPLTNLDTLAFLDILIGDSLGSDAGSKTDLDFAYEAEGIGRFRVNASNQGGQRVLAMRLVHGALTDLESLGLPPVCRALAMKPRGLIIVTGPVNSGKSTTMAAMIEYLNRTMTRRIITIEDPIEYTFSEGKCLITQRELGTDVPSFAMGVRSAMRQDPNVILVGEMRDEETVSACLTAAETGHLVMSTLHTPSASQVVDRLANVFLSGRQDLVRYRLAGLLEGVLYQVLLPCSSGRGLVLAVEVMLGTPAVRTVIREGHTHLLPNTIHTSTDVGMQTMDQSLLKLFQRKEITRENVLEHCVNRDEMQRLLGKS